MQIESICDNCQTEESLLAVLEELPPSLHETYDRLLIKIKAQVPTRAGLAGKVLLCLAFSLQPLSVEELMHMARHLGSPIDEGQPASQWTAENILSACYNLLVYNDGKLSFIHVSARQYIRRFWGRLHESRLQGEQGANALLAEACLRYVARPHLYRRI